MIYCLTNYKLILLLIVVVGFQAVAEKPHETSDSAGCLGLEKVMIDHGLVNVNDIDSTIKVELKYGSIDNFMKRNLYGGLTSCYLQQAAAKKLSLANKHLRQSDSTLRLLVVDGTRPRFVQRVMWGIVRGTPMQKYVADPMHGSMHNYGCAVDVTIVDSDGNRLDMGTPMDHFGELSQPRYEKAFLRKGMLTASQISNRRLLRRSMVAAGFRPLSIEWWHFDAFPKDSVRNTFSIVD